MAKVPSVYFMYTVQNILKRGIWRCNKCLVWTFLLHCLTCGFHLVASHCEYTEVRSKLEEDCVSFGLVVAVFTCAGAAEALKNC